MNTGFDELEVPAHDGATLHARMHAGSTAPLVFLHDLGMDGAYWQPVMQAIVSSDPDITMLAIDLRGHGASDRGTETSRKRLVKDLRVWLDRLQLPAPVLVGHGYGADIALASDIPAAVVAINPAFGREPVPLDADFALPPGLRGARDAAALVACTVGATEAKPLKRSRRDAPLFLVLSDPADTAVEGLETFLDVAEDVQLWRLGSRHLPIESPLGLAAILLGWELI